MRCHEIWKPFWQSQLDVTCGISSVYVMVNECTVLCPTKTLTVDFTPILTSSAFFWSTLKNSNKQGDIFNIRGGDFDPFTIVNYLTWVIFYYQGSSV